MGLLNKRNIAKVKALAEKNKDKIAANVTKATDAIDAKTDGKYADKLKKVDDAAKKYAGIDDTPDAPNVATTADRSGAPAAPDETGV